VGTTAFSRLEIPPLSQIVIARARGSVSALADELLALRERQARFRHYLSDYQRQWNGASTRRDRHRLKIEFDGAWQTLITAEDRPRPGKFFRILGFVWDLGKALSPRGAINTVGDKVVVLGRDRSIIRRARGLHDFYSELASAPIVDSNRRLIADLFPSVADDAAWRSAAKLARAMNQSMLKRDPSIL
jgi:hypothetical protein